MRVARRPRVHTFLATSPIHMKYKLRMSEDEVLQSAVAAVSHLRELGCADIEFSPEDASRCVFISRSLVCQGTHWLSSVRPIICEGMCASRCYEAVTPSLMGDACMAEYDVEVAVRRSDPQFLYRVLSAVIKAGATTLNIPDTTGWGLPHEFGGLIRDLRENVEGAETVVFSTHCQNDLGLSTANSIAGAMAGARQVECTINGIGERAGNASLEEVVMAIHLRG